ncbi:hypothetical protein Tco_1061986 [Tanacetum coccineum]
MPGCSWRGHLRGVHIHYCPGVLGRDTCEGYIFITARVFLEGTPVIGTYGFHYCSGVIGGDTYDGVLQFTHRASTSANLNLNISPVFVEANYEIIESLLRERRKQIRNEDLRTELEYFSEEYDEEMEMEPRPVRAKETTLFSVQGLLGLEDKGKGQWNLKTPQTSYHPHAQNGNPSLGGTFAQYPQGGYVPQAFAISNVPPYNGLGILGLHEEQRISGFVHGLRTRNLVEFLSTYLPTTYKGLMEKTYTWIEAREVATNGALNDRREVSIDYGHDTNQCRELRPDRRSRKIKIIGSPGERNKEGKGEGLSHLTRSLRVVSKTSLVGFSGEHSWPLGEVPVEITIGDALFSRTKILNFFIMRSNSPHNLLLERTTMQQMSIGVSTIYRAIKFHTPRGIGTVFLTRGSYKTGEEQEKLKETSQEGTKDILSCVDTKERIVVNDKYLEQTIAIGKQLSTSTKMKLRGFLRANADVFAWTSAHMIGIMRIIMIGGKPLNTEHRLNEFKHIKAVKQKRRSLALERNEEIRIQVEELVKNNILQEVKYQTWVSNPVIVKKANER